MNPRDDLREFVMGLPAVDAHEHLRPESVRLGKKPDVLWLFHQYACSDLQSAGLSEADLRAVMDTDGPLPRRWRMFQPFFERIRHTGYARAVLVALREIYGIESLDDRTYAAASERILAENRPGMIERWLHAKGHIVAILNNNYQIEQPPFCHSVMGLQRFIRPERREEVEQTAASEGASVRDLDSWLACLEAALDRYAREGVAALKMVSFPWEPVGRSEADALFARLLGGAVLTPAERNRLQSSLLDEALAMVPTRGFTVAVHCGYLAGVNKDFTGTHVRHMVPILQRHPEVLFDLFHLSYPWMDEAIAIGKSFTNVSLNLTWCAIVNPCATQRAMRDLVGAVPANKVLAMGGDYWELPDVAYGHLQMARRLLARSLAACMEEETLSLEEAKRVATLWLRENAYDVYPRLRGRAASSG